MAGIIRVRLPRCGYYDGFTAGGHILFGGVRLVRRDAVCIRTQEHLEALRQTIALLEEIEQEITFRRADLNMLSKKLQREHKTLLLRQK